MLRKIIHINKELCNGCGLCVNACHEGAIGLIDGKATLLREDYCDGLGNCLPACPTGAITFEEREALAYDEVAVLNSASRESSGSLNQWPCQIKLVAPDASYFSGCDLLIAADCTAYAYANFHKDFVKDRITLIGCPKLDAIDYSEKLTEILKLHDIKSITLVRMIVPCCGGMAWAVEEAIKNSGKELPLLIATISIDGKISKVERFSDIQ